MTSKSTKSLFNAVFTDVQRGTDG